MKKISNSENVLKQSLERLISLLKEGHTSEFQNYLNFCSRFHKYSFNNRLLIALQCQNASKVAGKNAWLKLNRMVKEGEKPLNILVPLFVYKKDKYGKKTKEKFLSGYKETAVYDISQTTGEDIPELKITVLQNNDHKNNYDYICGLMSLHGITVNEVDLGEHCFLRGRSFGGKVEINMHLPYDHKLKTLIHEWCHEILHQGSENLNFTTNLKEFEAETTAFLVCSALGLDATTSRDYILNWIRDEEFNEYKFSKYLDRALTTSDKIIGFINESLGQDVLDEENQDDQLKVA